MMRWPAQRCQRCSRARQHSGKLTFFSTFNLIHQRLLIVCNSAQSRASVASTSRRQDEQARDESMGELIRRRPVVRGCGLVSVSCCFSRPPALTLKSERGLNVPSGSLTQQL